MKRGSVKSSEKENMNVIEKGKDFLSDSEIRIHLEASKKSRCLK